MLRNFWKYAAWLAFVALALAVISGYLFGKVLG